MSANKYYRVEFGIEVKADTPEKACIEAWDSMRQCDICSLPIGRVTDSETGESQDIDLQEVYETQANPPV